MDQPFELTTLLRFITEILSWITIFCLVGMLLSVFSVRSKKALEAEIVQRIEAETQVRQLNEVLEQRVLQQTQQLFRSELNYRHLFQNNPLPMWIMDLDTFRFLNVNEAAILHYGYSREEFMLMTALDIRPAEEVEMFKKIDHTVSIGPDQTRRGEWKHCKKDGTVINVEIVAHNIEFAGRRARIILSNDVTARKLAEQELRDNQQLNEELEERFNLQNAQLEAVNNELESFSYSVSHDLQAPLRTIIGYTTLLEEAHSPQLDDEAKRLTAVISRSSLKMKTLIEGLLLFCRTSRHDIVKTDLNMGKIVEDVIEDHLPALTVKWNVHTLPIAPGEYNTMRQVWCNLISNAVKYSGRQEYSLIEIGSFVQENQTVFYVKDNGVGFDNQYRDKLFKVFQRLHSYKEFEGTGIGLALVEKIISKHGGKVWADAILNEGATFYFSLPTT